MLKETFLFKYFKYYRAIFKIPMLIFNKSECPNKFSLLNISVFLQLKKIPT